MRYKIISIQVYLPDGEIIDIVPFGFDKEFPLPQDFQPTGGVGYPKKLEDLTTEELKFIEENT